MSLLIESPTKSRLEHYKRGYPRLAAFVTLDRNFCIWKRFDYLHARSLLDLQDELVEMETELKELDKFETIQLHLSSRRQDSNEQRRGLLSSIRTKLEQYDKHLLRYHRVMSLPEARAEHRESISNWVDGTKPLVRAESACFLDMNGDSDFVALGASPEAADYALPEKALSWVVKRFPYFRVLDKTDDQNIVLFSPTTLRRIARTFTAFAMPLWLACQLLVLFCLSNDTSKAVVYGVFLLITSFVITFATNATKFNLMLALLTYAALPTALLAYHDDKGSPNKNLNST